MPKRYSFGFVADPLHTFNPEAETTLFLMREIARRGHRVFACEPRDLFLKQKGVFAHMKSVEFSRSHDRTIARSHDRTIALTSLDSLFLRKDPPFDLNYLAHLWMLARLEKKILMINSPTALLCFNEKISILDFPFAPKTYVGFWNEHAKHWAARFLHGVVVKPLNEAGGRGVKWIRKVVGRQSSVVSPKQPVMVQEFLPEIKNGDKRIMIWDGKVLGAFTRKPTKKGEFRANLHLGGRFEATTLTAADRRILKKVAPWTKREGLYFVGLDVIGSHLSEINVTSPMGLREINLLYGKKTESTIVDDLLRKI